VASLRRSGGFTLTELLVSMTIISILISLMVPVILAARAQARKLQCVHRLRQLGIAFHLYAENWVVYPHEDRGDSRPPFGCGWDEVLDPYLGDRRMYRCPSFEDRPDHRSYKMNSLLEDDADPFLSPAAVGRPARTVLLFDGKVDNFGVRRLPKGTWVLLDPRHRGWAHLLFADGHVGGVNWDSPETRGEGETIWAIR
jgi:prepilin-type N-terminal cleavage/methylation domain-containing protein/prepilin-type processing-associated H-X9-DG protein